MVTVKIPSKYAMNFPHLTKNIKLLCQVYHRCGMPPTLGTEDEIIQNTKPRVKKNKGQNTTLIMYDL